MTVGLEVFNDTGGLIVSSANSVNYRYRGKFTTTISVVSGGQGNERLNIALTGLVQPIIFYANSSAAPVYEFYSYLSNGVWHYAVACPENSSATFTAYVFDLSSADQNITATATNTNGVNVAVSSNFLPMASLQNSFGMQCFDADGKLTFDALNWQLPTRDHFVLPATMLATKTYDFPPAVCNLNQGYDPQDTGFGQWYTRWPQFRTVGNVLYSTKTTQNLIDRIYPPPSITFKAPIIAVIDTTKL